MSESCAEVFFGLFCGIFLFLPDTAAYCGYSGPLKLARLKPTAFIFNGLFMGHLRMGTTNLFTCSFSEQRLSALQLSQGMKPLQAALKACPAFGAAVVSSGLLASVSLGQ